MTDVDSRDRSPPAVQHRLVDTDGTNGTGYGVDIKPGLSLYVYDKEL